MQNASPARELSDSRKLSRVTHVLLLISAVIFFFGLSLTGCSTPLPTVPAFSTDGQHHPGKIIWHDLITPDINQAQTFYSQLFGWSFEEVTNGYSLISHNGHHIGGMARHNRSGDSAYWLPLMSVPDVDKAVKYTQQNQGTLLLNAFELPGRGQIAVVEDPLGAIFAVARTFQGDPQDRKADFNEWLWNEIWTNDLITTQNFYTGLAGFQLGKDTSTDTIYHYLKFKDTPRVGLIQNKDEAIGDTWIAYVRVEDVAASTARTEQLGGKILMPPTKKIRNGTVAVITDPAGAGLVLQEWNR